MRVCIYGVGALGGMLAARFHMADVDVWLYDTEPVMNELGKNGLEFTDEHGCSHQLQDLQLANSENDGLRFDYVILALKAHQISASLNELAAFIDDKSVLVTMQNGIPWWYFQQHDGEFENRTLQSVDPDGEIARALNARQVIGCVAYPAAETTGPGSVRHVEGNRLSFGELDGSRSARCEALADIFKQAGFRARMINDIRSETWLKALGNLSFNPVSALTRMTMLQICEFEPTKTLVSEMMYEAEQVATALNIRLRVSVERRLAGAESVGHHKTSMLQDLEAGRPMEIDALLGAIVEIGGMTGVPTPTMKRIYSLTKALDSSCQTDRQTAA